MKPARPTGFSVGPAADKSTFPRAKNGDAKSDLRPKRLHLEIEIIKNLVAVGNFGIGEVLAYGTPSTDMSA